MHIDTTLRGIPSRIAGTTVDQTIRAELMSLEGRVRHVQVQIGRVDGPKGARDGSAACRLRAWTRGGVEFVTIAVASSVDDAVAGAAQALCMRLRKAGSRRRTRMTRGGR